MKVMSPKSKKPGERHQKMKRMMMKTPQRLWRGLQQKSSRKTGLMVCSTTFKEAMVMTIVILMQMKVKVEVIKKKQKTQEGWWRWKATQEEAGVPQFANIWCVLCMSKKPSGPFVAFQVVLFTLGMLVVVCLCWYMFHWNCWWFVCPG